MGFIEPFSFRINDTDIPYFPPAFMLGSELSDGRCTFAFGDFSVVYHLWDCPRIKFETTVRTAITGLEFMKLLESTFRPKPDR